MKLSLFINSLLQDGNVTIPRKMHEFEMADLETSALLLHDIYEKDNLSMPFVALAFNEAAALWAAGYIFHICQLILLRDVDETELTTWLKVFKGPETAEAIYSADLMLRFLPDLFRLGSGLSPDDPMVNHLKATAIKWPFSSVGIDKITTQADDTIWAHPSLNFAYMDRIIERKDLHRLKSVKENEKLKEILGAHQAVLWPEFALQTGNEST